MGNSFLSYAKRRIGDDLHPGIREALPLLREVRLDVGLAGDALERPFGDLAAMRFSTTFATRRTTRRSRSRRRVRGRGGRERGAGARGGGSARAGGAL